MANGLRQIFSAGLKANSFRFSGFGGSTFEGGSGGFFGWNSLLGLLPGSKYDYKREAGDLWANSIVLAFIKWQCRNYPDAEQVVLRRGKDKKLEMVREHPLLDLIESPNKDYDRSVLEAGILLSMAVDGNAYLYKVRSPAGKVIGLQYIPHMLIAPWWPKDGSVFIGGYVYWADHEPILIPNEDIIHLRDGIDPRNVRKGLSPLGAVLREICTDNEAATFSAAIMRNMGIPGVVISPKVGVGITALTADQIDAIKTKWREKFRGENRGDPFVNGIPVDVHAPGFSPEQLALDKVRSVPVGRIAAAFGIDPMVVALPSDSKTYSNYPAALDAAYGSNLKPLHKLIDSQMTLQLADDYVGLGMRPSDKLGRDYANVDALQPDQDKLFARVAKIFVSCVIPRSVAKRMIGEGFDVEDETIYYSDLMGKAPVDPEADPSGEDPAAEDVPPDAGKMRSWIAGAWRKRREALLKRAA